MALDKTKLPPGAVIIIIGPQSLEDLETSLDTQVSGNLSYDDKAIASLKNFTFKIMVPTENGDLLAFNPAEDYTEVIDYTGGNLVEYINDMVSSETALYVTPDEYESMYLQSSEWIEVPQNFFDTKIGQLTAEEAALMDDTDFTIADQIDIAMNSFNTLYGGTTKFNSPTYKRKWQEGYLIFQDVDMANMYVSTSPVMKTVLSELGKTQAEVTAMDFYDANQAQYALDLSAQKSTLYDILPTGANVDDKTMEWIANKVIMGTWPDSYARSQIFKLTDKYRDTELNKDLQSFVSNSKIDQTTIGEKEVTQTIEDWLPPSARQDYLDDIAMHAGKYRQDASYLKDLENELKTTRYALYPQYDKDTKWSIIDRITKNTIKNKWDMEIDPNGQYSYVYNKVAALNDVNEANKYLVQEGLSNNISGVVNDFAKDMISSFGGSIIRSQNFLEPSTQRIR